MDESLEDLYFNWLCAKVLHLENPTPSLTFDKLFRVLHGTEFVWLVSGDDNRLEDGLDLRGDFLSETGILDVLDWEHQPCSLFEMLIAFSKKAQHMTDVPYKEWFWEFLENLGLKQYNDATDIQPDEINEVLYALVWRTYDFRGHHGGLFPVNDPTHDQTQTEIWYQFCEYLIDQNRMP